MLAIADVHYAGARARAGCVIAADWGDAAPVDERTAEVEVAAEYVPGELYRRELPPLLAVLDGAGSLDAVIVDAHVWLAPGRPGLGGHLHAALGIPVVGVAKNEFRGAPSLPVVRGAGARPLWVSAIGLDPADAAARVAAMHGPHRLPTLLLRADHLARGLP